MGNIGVTANVLKTALDYYYGQVCRIAEGLKIAFTPYPNASPSEYLTGIYDQISQSVSCRQEFSYDNSHQAQPDIDFHIADDGRYRAWQHHLCQCVEPVAAQGIDQLDLPGIDSGEAGIQA